MKPDFLIIGAAKSGTTSLITDIRRHPDIFTPGVEVNYFSHYFEKGDDWYLAKFRGSERFCGEKSTSYMYAPVCAKRIFDFNPSIKLIILLREPVKRAFSNWTMRHVQHRLLIQAHTFNSRGRQQIGNLGFAHLFKDYLACQTDPVRFYEPMDIFERGLYMDQIERFLSFFPREQLLILVAERYFRTPEETLKRISHFLETDDFPAIPPAWKRKMEYPVTLDEKIANEVRSFYKPHNDRLFSFLGDQIPEWQYFV
jgi:hypothetical protein